MTAANSTRGIRTANPFLGNDLGFDGLPTVVAASVESRTVAVEFSDAGTRRFHHQWLRHSCYCAECGNPADGIRFHTVSSADRDLTPIQVMAEDGDLSVTWDGGHRSRYGADWLWHHAYDDQSRTRRHGWRPVTWRSDLPALPAVPWTKAADGGEGQLGLYHKLRDYGIVRVEALGTDPDRTEELASLIGPIHETTVYGRMYDVRAEPVAKLGAKTGMDQAPHIDDAFYYSPPGIDVFHCVVGSAEGGLSTYVDGFAIAESMATEAPDAYNALTTLPIGHVRRHPDEIELRSRGPLISVDENDRPSGIRYFDRALAPPDIAADDVDRLFDSIREFERRMHSSEFVVTTRVDPGDGMLIDNHRVLHGRTEFDPSQGRHIRLCHVPRDEFHGRWRELSRRLDPGNHDLHLPAGAATRCRSR